MALSVIQDPKGIDWPIGFVAVAANGTPVNIMHNVDANNNNAPGTAANGTNSEYTPTCHKIIIQGYKPGANNNGMVPNSGYLYILRSFGPGNQNFGGTGNRADSGCMVQIVPPGGQAILPADELDRAPISPYRYTLDADVNGDGGLVTLLGCAR